MTQGEGKASGCESLKSDAGRGRVMSGRMGSAEAVILGCALNEEWGDVTARLQDLAGYELEALDMACRELQRSIRHDQIRRRTEELAAMTPQEQLMDTIRHLGS